MRCLPGIHQLILILLISSFTSIARGSVVHDPIARTTEVRGASGMLLRKALRGDIALPIVRIETSQKAQRGVHLVDLAGYIDKRRAAAVKECRQLTGTI
jgi:hypothetical protein